MREEDEQKGERGERGCNEQGWEFAHQFSEQIARFLGKNE